MAFKEYNTDIGVQGKISLTTVPNKAGTLLTYGSEGDISTRTNTQIISDLGLISATNIAASYYTKTEVDINIKNAVDSIQIGGRNLLRNSKDEIGGTLEYIGIQIGNHIAKYGISEQEFTMSFDLKSDVAGDFVFYSLGDYAISGVTQHITTEWKRYSHTFKIVIKKVEGTNIDYSIYGNYGTGKYIHARNIKLELGNKATDWTPALEDQVADWNTTDVDDFSFIKNKPTKLSQFTNDSNFLTQETDPTVPAHVKSISTVNINNWNSAFKDKNLFSNVEELNDINLPAGNYKIELANIPGLPNLYTSIINTGQYSGGGYSQQLGIPFESGNHLGLWLRTSVGSNWNPWYKMWDSTDFSRAHLNNWDTAFSWGNHAGLYAPLIHTHSMAQITGLKDALNNKDNYQAWYLKTNGEQSLILTAGSALDIRAGINVDITYENSIDLNNNRLTGLLTINAINTDTNTTYVQGDGISITGANNVITNTKPNVVQTLSGSGNTVNLSNGGSYTIPAQSWGSITGKPATFPPSAHSHTIGEVTGLQGALDGKVTIDANRFVNFGYSSMTDANKNDITDLQGTLRLDGWYALNVDALVTHGTRLTINGLGSHDKTQFYFNGENGSIQYRKSWYSNTEWTSLRTLWDSGNLTQASINSWNTAVGWGNHAGLYAPINHSHTFASITNKPTTIAGYGITDSYIKTEVDTNIKTAVDDIQIGGRNLFQDSSFKRGLNTFQFKYPLSVEVIIQQGDYDGTPTPRNGKSLSLYTALSGDTYVYISQQIPVEPNAEYVVSFWIKGGGAITGNSSSYQESNGLHFAYPGFFIDNTKTWRRMECVIRPSSDATWIKLRFGFVCIGNAWISVANIQVEKGTKATDWTPAPEDQISDWNTTDVNDFSFLKNKPTKLSQFTNDSNFLTQETDPTVPTHVKSISARNISEWNESFKRRTSFVSNIDANDKSFLSGYYSIETANGTGNTNFPSNSVYGVFSRMTSLAFTTDMFYYNDGAMAFRTWYGSNPPSNWRVVWDNVNLTNLSQLSNDAGYLTSIPTHSHSEYVTLGTNQTISGVKTFSNSVTAPAFYEGSLKSLKKNIKIFEKSGLELIEQLEIVTFDRKDKSAVNKIGIIADDSPKEFLSEELDAVDLYKTVFIQAKAIQELTEEVNNLRELIIAKLNKI